MASVANLRRLADYLETEVKDGEFNMAIGMSTCGSVGCIAGHAARLFHPDRLAEAPVVLEGRSYSWLHVQALANLALDLTGRETLWLFTGAWQSLFNCKGVPATRTPDIDQSRAAAAAALRRLADHYEAITLEAKPILREALELELV